MTRHRAFLRLLCIVFYFAYGGVISPLLANIYLHPLDIAMDALPDIQFVRYADELVCPGTL